MIPADKIKWILENIKPEGFGYDDLGLNTEHSCFGWGLLDGYGNDVKGFNLWQNVYYPLFLQRVIESVNRIEDTHTRIIYGCSEYGRKPHVSGADYKSFKPLVTYYEKDFDFIDEAKEKAILYIVDKMRATEEKELVKDCMDQYTEYMEKGNE